MKQILTTAFTLLPLGAFAATNVSFANFTGNTSGRPIVDNVGAPIDSANLTLSVGTFADAFAATLRTLDITDGDAAVLAAFQQTGASVPFNPAAFPGLFGNAVTDADNGNSLAGQNIFLMVQDTTSATAQVLVFDLGNTFPTQNAAGAGSTPGKQVSFGDVVFGFVGADGTGVDVDTAKLTALNPGFGAGGFNKGIAFGPVDAIPEPSTGLLAGLAGLALVARRRR